MTIRTLARLGLCLALFSAAGTVSLDAGAAGPPTLTVKAVFDQSRYVSGQTVTIKFSVHNPGARAAPKITVPDESSRNGLYLGSTGFGKFERGVTIPAGRTVTVTLIGHLKSLTATTVKVAGYVYDRSGNDVTNYSFSAPVKVRTATVRGEVFGDKNGNGHADAGEGVSGAKVRLSYLYGTPDYSVTTGRHGRFTIVVPTAEYYLDGGGKGWDLIARMLTVPTHGTTPDLRAVHPLKKKVLTAKVRFTKAHYKIGAKVHVTVTLRNNGSARLSGITAACDRVGDPDEINDGEGWGDLAFYGRGAGLAAHQTRVFHATGKVPAGARRTGQVVVDCDFGYSGVDKGYRPEARATATVPAEPGAVSGDVGYYVHGHSGPTAGLKDVRVVLVDATKCPVFTHSAKTDANGRFRMAHVPVGTSYQFYVYPPKGWKVLHGNPTNAEVFSGNNNFAFQVAHGSGHTPSPPTTCS